MNNDNEVVSGDALAIRGRTVEELRATIAAQAERLREARELLVAYGEAFSFAMDYTYWPTVGKPGNDEAKEGMAKHFVTIARIEAWLDAGDGEVGGE